MHQLQFFRASGRLPRRFFWSGVLLLLILLSCAVFVSVLLAGVARSATGSETVSFAVFAVLGGLSILAGLYSLTCLMSQRLHDFGRPGIWALGFYALLAVGIAGIRIGGIAGALMILPFAGLVFFGTRPSDPAHNIYGDPISAPLPTDPQL